MGDDKHAARLALRLPLARENPDALDAGETSFGHMNSPRCLGWATTARGSNMLRLPRPGFDWPICTSMAAMAAGASRLRSELAAVNRYRPLLQRGAAIASAQGELKRQVDSLPVPGTAAGNDEGTHHG
jgi:hypothetical protein